MNRKELLQALQKSNLAVQIPGFSQAEATEAFYHIYNLSGDAVDLKTSLTKALSSKWPGLEKSVLGGIQHVISADNGAYYAELWNKGGSWYAVTGAELQKAYDLDGAFYAIKGITKSMKLSDVVPRFLDTFGFNDMKLSKGEVAKPCNCKD